MTSRKHLSRPQAVEPPALAAVVARADLSRRLHEPLPAETERLISACYRTVTKAVREWGGAAALASLIGARERDVQARLSRESHHGQPQRAFVDWIGVLLADERAAEIIVHGICDAAGFERPRRLAMPEDPTARLLLRMRREGFLDDRELRRLAREEAIDISGVHGQGDVDECEP